MIWSGCDSVGYNNSTTPQVSGRVLAADTHLPLAGVKVLHVLPGQLPDAANPAKGAQLLLQGRPVTTDTNGVFVFPSSSYMTFFRHASWWSLKLWFQTAGYVALQTNFTVINIKTNLPDGTPVADAGEILLLPLPK